MNPILFKSFNISVTPQTIEGVASNVYGASGYLFTESGEVYSPYDFDYVWDMYGEHIYYAIHWEGDDLCTEDGKAIESVY